MIFATFRTPKAGPVPALVKKGRLYPLPFADMHEVIRVGATEAAQHASEASFAIDEVRLLAPLRPTSLRDGYAEDVIPYPHYASALDFELVKQKLNATDPNAFSPSLINLDALIQSMLITGTP